MDSESNTRTNTWQLCFLSNMRNSLLVLEQALNMGIVTWNRLWMTERSDLIKLTTELGSWWWNSFLPPPKHSLYIMHYSQGGQRQSKNYPTIFTLSANNVSRFCSGYNAEKNLILLHISFQRRIKLHALLSFEIGWTKCTNSDGWIVKEIPTFLHCKLQKRKKTFNSNSWPNSCILNI